MPIDDTASFTINVLPLFSGKILIAYTYSHQITEEKIDILLQHHFNTLIIDGMIDNNADYSNKPEQVSPLTLQCAQMAHQKSFALFSDLHFSHPRFNPDTSRVPGGFPVVYSNGDEGHLMSPFCGAYWQWLTDYIKNLALLSVNHPDEYRVDGVFLDFELYGHDEGHTGYFNAEYGFEDQTFDEYCVLRGITNPQIPADQRFNWLVQQGKIIVDPQGNHTGDYYLFLSNLIKGYATEMRQQIHAIKPDFYIGSYPSPSSRYYYLIEIQSGWGTPTKPSFIVATEMYYSGGASAIPSGLSNLKQPGGWYDLTTIYQSHTSTNNPIYAYYICGIVIMRDSTYYFSKDYAYNTYNLAKETNGYFVFTTYSLTETFEILPDYYRIWYYDEATNSLIRPTVELYPVEVQRYYDQMDIMHDELLKYLLDPSYISPLAPTIPPPIVYEYPEIIPYPSLQPIQTPINQPLTFTYQPRLRGIHYIILYAQQQQNVQFTMNYRDVTSTHCGLQYLITDNDTNILTQGYMNYLNNQQNISFIAPYTGCYLLSIHPTTNGSFYITNTNTPMVIYKQDEIHTIGYVSGNKYNLFFWVETEPIITLTIRGQNSAEGAAVSIYRPISGSAQYVLFTSGTTTPEQTSITFDLQMPPDAQQEIWKIEITKPENQILEDVWISSPQKEFFFFTDDQQYCLK